MQVPHEVVVRDAPVTRQPVVSGPFDATKETAPVDVPPEVDSSNEVPNVPLTVLTISGACSIFATAKLWSTMGATAICVLPAWPALIVHVPPVLMVTVVSLMEHTDSVREPNVTINPEVAVAPTLNATSPNVLAGSVENMIV